MDIKNENENINNIQKILLIGFKITFIIISLLFAHQIVKKVGKNLEKDKIDNKSNIIFIEKNKSKNTYENINVFYNNSIVSSTINNIDKNKEKNGDMNVFQNLITYEYIYFNSFNIFNAVKKIYFNILSKNYTFSIKYKLVKLEYTIGLYDKNNNLLKPSEMTLYYDLHFACFLELQNKKIINSLAYVYLDKYIKCKEYFKYKENVKLGFIIYRRISFFKVYFLPEDFIDYNDTSHLNDTKFNAYKINSEFYSVVNDIKSNKFNKPYSLKKAYFRRPIFNLRRNFFKNNTIWLFRNFYNEYFCSCIGNNCFKEADIQTCKFLYYIVIIDNEREVYPKTDYIFVDFIFKSLSSDDTYPVFEEMIRQNYSAHYITEKDELKNKYCQNDTHCQTIIPINIYSYFTYGDFFEKYLSLVLKTKAFISGKEKHFHRVGYLFYRIEYITYIGVGHGVCYFKDYLFDNNRIYGRNRNNKIVIPPSKILVETAVNHGWKKEDIIQLNLPRWDRYNYPLNQGKITDSFSGNITENSILIMFTWRMNEKYFNSFLSPYYMANLANLLNNEDLKQEIEKNDIILYVSFHRYLKETYQEEIKNILRNNNNIKIIEQNYISECLSKTNLVITDFSSIIFDLMYRNKPFILFIPDEKDPNITNIYSEDYIQLIERMNNGTFKIENKCEDVDETVKKIIYYIKNKFEVDENLKKYFKYFDFKHGNNINKFINYLLSL